MRLVFLVRIVMTKSLFLTIAPYDRYAVSVFGPWTFSKKSTTTLKVIENRNQRKLFYSALTKSYALRAKSQDLILRAVRSWTWPRQRINTWF